MQIIKNLISIIFLTFLPVENIGMKRMAPVRLILKYRYIFR